MKNEGVKDRTPLWVTERRYEEANAKRTKHTPPHKKTRRKKSVAQEFGTGGGGGGKRKKGGVEIRKK